MCMTAAYIFYILCCKQVKYKNRVAGETLDNILLPANGYH